MPGRIAKCRLSVAIKLVDVVAAWTHAGSEMQDPGVDANVFRDKMLAGQNAKTDVDPF